MTTLEITQQKCTKRTNYMKKFLLTLFLMLLTFASSAQKVPNIAGNKRAVDYKKNFDVPRNNIDIF